MYKHTHFNYLYTDIDECADGTNGCNHNCSNTNGSYVCFCFTGYELHDNMQTCTGNVCYKLIVSKKHRCEYNAKHTCANKTSSSFQQHSF